MVLALVVGGLLTALALHSSAFPASRIHTPSGEIDREDRGKAPSISSATYGSTPVTKHTDLSDQWSLAKVPGQNTDLYTVTFTLEPSATTSFLGGTVEHCAPPKVVSVGESSSLANCSFQTKPLSEGEVQSSFSF